LRKVSGRLKQCKLMKAKYFDFFINLLTLIYIDEKGNLNKKSFNK